MTAPQVTPSRKIGLREFLRGGYRDLRQPVTVTNHKRPVAVWVPITETERKS